MKIHSARKNQSLVHKRNAGFTLVELMVVSTITVLLLLSVSSMLMTFLLSNAKTNISRQIKAEGNEMISQLEFVFRNAKSMTGAGTGVDCASPTPQNLANVVITGLDSSVNTLAFATPILSLNGNRLNSEFVITESPKLTCLQDPSTLKTSVKIEFVLSRTDGSKMEESFQSIIQLRNS